MNRLPKKMNNSVLSSMWDPASFLTLGNFFSILSIVKMNHCWQFMWISIALLRWRLTFGLMGFSTGMSVPSALCLLESKTFLFLVADFWQIFECFSCWRRTMCTKHDKTFLFLTPLAWHHLRFVSVFYYNLSFQLCFPKWISWKRRKLSFKHFKLKFKWVTLTTPVTSSKLQPTLWSTLSSWWRPKPILLYISRIIHHALMQPLSTNEAKCLHKSTYLVVYQKILFKLNTKNLYSFDVLTL